MFGAAKTKIFQEFVEYDTNLDISEDKILKAELQDASTNFGSEAQNLVYEK